MNFRDTIWLFNVANWKIPDKLRFLAGKIIYFYGPFPWLCQITRGYKKCLLFICLKMTKFRGLKIGSLPMWMTLGHKSSNTPEVMKVREVSNKQNELLEGRNFRKPANIYIYIYNFQYIDINLSRIYLLDSGGVLLKKSKNTMGFPANFPLERIH